MCRPLARLCFASFALVSACGQPGAVVTDDGRLFIEEKPDASGLLGSFDDGDTTLYFETSQEAGVVVNEDGSRRDYEISARYADDEGRTYFASSDGHAIPSDWELDPTGVRDTERLPDVVAQTAQALAALSSLDGHLPLHVQALLALAGDVATAREKLPPAPPVLGKGSDERISAPTAPGYDILVDLYWKTAVLDIWPNQ
ncbi:MAG: hypothetical protein AAB426_04810, partial [Myxococcota bacterium]